MRNLGLVRVSGSFVGALAFVLPRWCRLEGRLARLRGTAIALALLPVLGAALPASAATIVDFVFMVDTSRSMKRDLREIINNLSDLDDSMQAAGIDARYSLIRFGTSRIGKGPTAPELLVDLTDDFDAFNAGLATLPLDIVEKTEAGTEAIMFALDQLSFRDGAVPNLVLYTDENDDAPVSAGGKREPPFLWNLSGRSAEFQFRLNQTSDALIDLGAQLNLIIKPSVRNAQRQYGIPDATVLTADGELDIEATYANLLAKEREDSLQGQLLDAGLVARSFNIRDGRRRRTSDEFWADFIDAKTREILAAPVPEPGLATLLLVGSVFLARGVRQRARA